MKDKVVVITGASAGIGAALAEEVVRRGGQVALSARTAAALEAVAGKVGGLAVVADATVRADHARLCAAAIERFGHIDVWVNNAGRGVTRMPSQLTDDDIDQMMLVNFKSAVYGAQAVLPHFQARGQGHLINVSSMLGRIPSFAPRCAYSAAKHALNAFTANLRMELEASHPGVRVTLFLPGVVATDFGNHALHGGVDSRKLPGAQSAEEVARVIADGIEQPRADLFSRPDQHAAQAAYYAAEDIASALPRR